MSSSLPIINSDHSYQEGKIHSSVVKGETNSPFAPSPSESEPSSPELYCNKKTLSLVRCAIHKFDLLPASASLTPIKVGIALSGGKDSLALLIALKNISGRGIATLELYALHIGGSVNCGSSLSLVHSKRVCEMLEVPLHVKTAKKQEKLECYSCARERRRLLFSLADELGITTIAFGHHRDDNAQTLLLNMLQGAKPAGMLPKVPMLHYGITIIRPLILIPESVIISEIQAMKLLRATCQCPVGQRSKRREVKKLIEDLEKKFPLTREHLATVALQWGDQGALTPS